MSNERTPGPSFLYKLKIAAMLHDPPDKAWHVMKMKRGGHEEVSEKIRRELFPELGEVYRSLASKADFLAAATDRWFTEVFDAVIQKPPKRIVLVNPLSLGFKEPEEPREDFPGKWLDEMRGFKDELWGLNLSEEEKYKWFYHILYGFGELLYMEKYPQAVSPADTRMPHHSVFDHLSATASLSNWLGLEGEPAGLLVMLDLAGVQAHLRASRKLCDLWFRSFLSSFLAWYLVEELVGKLGPDILITPTARLNPFYLRWLLNELPEGNLRRRLTDLLGEFSFEGGARVFRLEEAHPILPTALHLILPPLSFLKNAGLLETAEEEGLVNYFKKRYKQCWSRIVELAKEEMRGGGFELLKASLSEMTGEDIPPLALRCAILRIPEEVKEEAANLCRALNEKLKETGLEKIQVREEDFYFLVGLKKIQEKAKKASTFKGKATLAADFQAYTERKWERRERFDYCTVCGEFPAILKLPRREQFEGLVPDNYRVVFDEGEHLCQRCLVERLVATVSREKFLELALGSKLPKRFPRRFPSVSWQAIYPFLREITLKEDKKGEKEKRLLEEEKKVRGKEELDPRDKEGAARALTKLRGTFVDGKGQRRDFVEGGDEALMHLCDTLDTGEVESLLAAGVGGKYFSLVQADADDMGKLLGGRFKQMGLSEAEMFVEIVKRTGEYDKERLERFREVVAIYLQTLGNLDKKAEESEAPKLWPSLLTTISRSLILSALRDVSTAERVAPWGVTVVYAGGDDLLLVAPITSSLKGSLKVVEETRRRFSEGDGESFFELWAGGRPAAFFPTLGRASRSYANIFYHYRAPLSLALRSAREGLDRAKKTTTLMGATKIEKDALFLEYRSRGGAGAWAVVPLNPQVLDYFSLLQDILQRIKKEELSGSFVRDLLEVAEKYDRILLDENAIDSYRSLILRAVERNVKDSKSKQAVLEGIGRLADAAKVMVVQDGEERAGDGGAAGETGEEDRGKGEKARDRGKGEKARGGSLLLSLAKALFVGSVALRGWGE